MFSVKYGMEPVNTFVHDAIYCGDEMLIIIIILRTVFMVLYHAITVYKTSPLSFDD